MINQPTLFKLSSPLPDPTQVEKRCPLCKRQLLFDKHGMARHRRGQGRLCEMEMRARWAKKAGGES